MRRQRPQIGAYGWSLISQPAMTGVHSSSSPTRVRIRRVLPCPRSPSSTRSWPASSARSTSGITVSSKPTMPGRLRLPGGQPGDEVLAQLGLDAAVLMPGRAQLGDRRDRGAHGLRGSRHLLRRYLRRRRGCQRRPRRQWHARVRADACQHDQVIAALRAGHDSLSRVRRPARPDAVVTSVRSQRMDDRPGAEPPRQRGRDHPRRARRRADRCGRARPGLQPVGLGSLEREVAGRSGSRLHRRERGARARATRRIDAATRESLRIDLGFLPEPVDLATAAGMRLNEFALHAWDVLVAFDPAVTVPSSAAGLLVDRSGWLFGFLGHADALDGRSAQLAVHLSAPDRQLRRRDRRRRLARRRSRAQPTSRSPAPAEAWLRLISGRLAARAHAGVGDADR